ncbi:hypothetical protein KUV46_15235 [Thalassovita mediterranea]|nr:hypothetical protein KUV46_15235 [Thalassovita mediterranea]
MKLSAKRLGAIFALPAIIFAVSLAGLVAALLFEGSADLIFAIASGFGLIVAAAVIVRK